MLLQKSKYIRHKDSTDSKNEKNFRSIIPCHLAISTSTLRWLNFPYFAAHPADIRPRQSPSTAIFEDKSAASVTARNGITLFLICSLKHFFEQIS
jgi:hypothetical protein